MSDDKRINKDERSSLSEIEKICGVSFRRVDMQSYTNVENLFNFDETGSIIMLGIDFTSLKLDDVKIYSLGTYLKEFTKLKRLLIKIAENKNLPDWLKDLDYLDALIITNSYLLEIPDFIRNFKNLNYLILSGNRINSLPEWLPSLRNLKELNINSSIPSLELNEKNIDILRSIHEMGVKINDSVYHMHVELGLPLEQVKLIREIKNVRGENIVKGRLMSKIDEPFDNLFRGPITLRVFNGKVRQMGAFQSSLHELPEDFGKMEGITEISLKENKLQVLPKSFGELTELKKLDLSYNELSTLPDSFINLISITKLDLSNNKFQEIPTQLWALKELTELNLSNNPLNDNEKVVAQKVPDLIREHLRKKATITIFISHAVIDFDKYQIGKLVDFLKSQNEISEVYFCERDLAGNIDQWMLDTVQKSQLLLFVASKKSVFESVDCENELQLADKFSIPVIPLKGIDVEWKDLAELNLSRELGIEYTINNFDSFCTGLYNYILNFKREIDLLSERTRKQGITDIYERFRLILNDTVDPLRRRIEILEEKIKKLED